MQSTKIIMTLCVRWKRPVKSTITLNLKDIEDNQYVGGSVGDNYIKTEMPFSSLMTEFFERSKQYWQTDTTYVYAYQDAGKKLSNAGSNHPPAHQVDDLALTRDTSYIELPE